MAIVWVLKPSSFVKARDSIPKSAAGVRRSVQCLQWYRLDWGSRSFLKWLWRGHRERESSTARLMVSGLDEYLLWLCRDSANQVFALSNLQSLCGLNHYGAIAAPLRGDDRWRRYYVAIANSK
jgi:hypothetical protein